MSLNTGSRSKIGSKLVALFLACLFGCTSGIQRSKQSGRTLTVAIESTPLAIDPRYATDVISSRVNELIYDSLVRPDSRGGFDCDLAQSVELATPTRWIFHLRRGVRFSNGAPLSARDVKYTFDSVLDPRFASIKRGGFEVLEQVEALDDFTVCLTTKKPFPATLELAALGIVPRNWPAAEAQAAPPGTGPFKLESFKRDDRIVLGRNPYWDGAKSNIERLVFKVIPDPIVRALELLKGEVDLAENNIPPEMVKYLSLRRSLQVITAPGVSYQYIVFNFRDPRLRDLRVRRAIAMSIDRATIVKTILGGTARLATGMLSPENWAYEPEVMTYPYDPVTAERLLDEAGYKAAPNDKSKVRLTLVYKTTGDEERRRLAQVFQAMLAKVGIRLDIRTNEWATFYSDIQHGNFELASLAWVGINDPHHYYTVFDSKMTPPRGSNRGSYANPEMDRLLERAESELNPENRRRLYSAVQKLAAADLPYVSLWWQDNVAVLNRRVKGFKPCLNGSLRSLVLVSFAGNDQADGK